jgi:hypothetical protein
MLGINYSTVSAAIVIAASALTLGCSSEARPVDLTPIAASALISQRWSQDELDHFKVIFHSDTVVECGVTNDLWKLTETTDRGYTRTAYQLTEKGNKALFAIDLSDSGKGHAITLRGPYHFEVTNITPGSQPDSRYVFIHWGIDWDKAAPDLKACVPKFELSGSEIALFQIDGRDWRFVSYLSPEDAAAVQSATPAP